jgi:DnaK suppressor protein
MAFEWARKALLESRRQVEDKMQDSKSYGLDDSMGDELSELSLYDNHPADVASELYERGKDLGIKISDKQRLMDIQMALNALDNGTYGTCAHCGKMIPEERLEANPTAILCVPCKGREELTHPDRKRPIEEDVLYPGFGRSDLDGTDKVEFDGEDSWQAVERFNNRNPDDMIYEDIDMDENIGIVDSVDFISNEQYRDQLPPSRK